MKSIESLYKIGIGPSSSHTMGPAYACDYILTNYQDIKKITVTLFGSLALTGVGHLTDKIIKDKLQKYQPEIIFDYITPKNHANTLIFNLTFTDGTSKDIEVISIGGGDIIIDSQPLNQGISPYEEENFLDFKDKFNNPESLIDYLFLKEPQLYEHLTKVKETMIAAVDRGLKNDSVLPGKLKLKRFAPKMYESAQDDNALLSSYAQACSEENAAGGLIVTAPTCGACGIIPAIIYHYQTKVSDDKLIRGLALAGLFGNIVRENASISGSEAGCQAEVGTATSMGAALLAYLNNYDLDQIEIAAVIGFEHQLGLTCDPVLGYVQMPCINRNAMGVIKAKMAAEFARSMNNHKFSFDQMCQVMYETGINLAPEFRETSLGGLAKSYLEKNKPS